MQMRFYNEKPYFAGRKRVARILILAACFVFLMILYDSPLANGVQGAKTKTMPREGVCAHRGANSLYPENTLPAFEEAIRRGAEMIELDVKYSKDKAMIILHDGTIDRTSNGQGRPVDWTFDELRQFDFGSWKGVQFAGTKIPTLAEVLDIVPPNVWVNIHMVGNVELGLEIADLVVKKGMEHQAFLATSPNVMQAVRERYPTFQFCNMDRQGGNVSAYVAKTIEWRCDFIQLTRLASPEEMEQLRSAGVRINYFGTNNKQTYDHLKSSGVDFPLVDDLPAVGR